MGCAQVIHLGLTNTRFYALYVRMKRETHLMLLYVPERAVWEYFLSGKNAISGSISQNAIGHTGVASHTKPGYLIELKYVPILKIYRALDKNDSFLIV